MTDIYQETDSYEIPYDEYHPYEPEYEDDFYEDDLEEEFVYDEDESHDVYHAHAATGKRRVMRLMLILLVVLLIVGVVIFGVIPYVDSMTQASAPFLPPAVQT